MAPPLPPNLTNGTTAALSSPPPSPGVSDVADKDPFGEKPARSSDKPGEKTPSDESVAEPVDEKLPLSTEKPDEHLATSGDKRSEFVRRLDPTGSITVLCLASMVYTLVISWRFWCLLDRPADQFWSSSLHLWLLLFVWTISLSDSPKSVISTFSHILLLSCAATHFIGPVNGMLVMFIGTLYAAGLLGYTASGHCQRVGLHKSALALVASRVKARRKNYEVGASLLCSLISLISLVGFARIACLVLVPDMTHQSFFKAFDYAIEMWVEICFCFGLWTLYITDIYLGRAVLSLDTFAWAAPSFLSSGLLISVVLLLAIGDAVTILVLWIVAMMLMSLFGYVLALRACYMATIVSCHPSTKWAQRSDKVYLTIELADAKDVLLNLKPDGRFNFSAKDPDEIHYELHLELFGAINVEESKVAVAPGTICYLISKAKSKWWPRLFKSDGKPPLFLKVDLDKWQVEDDKNSGPDDFGDMVFMKLHNGGDE